MAAHGPERFPEPVLQEKILQKTPSLAFDSAKPAIRGWRRLSGVNRPNRFHRDRTSTQGWVRAPSTLEKAQPSKLLDGLAFWRLKGMGKLIRERFNYFYHLIHLKKKISFCQKKTFRDFFV